MGLATPLTSQLQRNRVDRFFVQQCAARRFKRDYATHYMTLRAIRALIVKHIENAGILPQLPFCESVADVAIALMGIYETAKGRQALRDRNISQVRHEIGSLIRFPMILTCDESLQSVIEDMAEQLEVIEEILNKYNIFHYFSLIAMTAVSEGKTAYSFFVNAAMGKIPIYEAMKTPSIVRETYWFHTRVEPTDLDLAIAIKVCTLQPFFYAPNISLFDDTHNEVYINGNASRNSLFLSIDLRQAPHRIDFALQHLKKSIFSALLDKHGILANVSGLNDFYSSSFMHNETVPYVLIGKWTQVLGSMIGLWCWDLVEVKGLTRFNACGHIEGFVAQINFELGFSLTPNF